MYSKVIAHGLNDGVDDDAQIPSKEFSWGFHIVIIVNPSNGDEALVAQHRTYFHLLPRP